MPFAWIAHGLRIVDRQFEGSRLLPAGRSAGSADSASLNACDDWPSASARSILVSGPRSQKQTSHQPRCTTWRTSPITSVVRRIASSLHRSISLGTRILLRTTNIFRLFTQEARGTDQDRGQHPQARPVRSAHVRTAILCARPSARVAPRSLSARQYRPPSRSSQ